MTTRDREVLDLLRDEPELLAIADAVAETQRESRRLRPFRALGAVALAAAAIFVLVLASPWDRGAGNGAVLDRALAAIETQGPVLHLTMRIDFSHAQESFRPVVTESFYDRQKHIVRMVSRIGGKVESDYTTSAVEDEFSSFPGLLDQADFYRRALANGQAKVVGKGEWQGRPVYWVELEKGGGFVLRIGVDRDSYRPVVFRGLNPDGTPAGFQLGVLGLDYVSTTDAAFEPNAPILVTGRVVGPDCRPVRARVGASIAGDSESPRVAVDVAAARTGPGGTFTLRADPAKDPFPEALANGGSLNFDLYAIAGSGATPKFVGFSSFSRAAQGVRWDSGPPLTIHASRGSSADRC